MWIASIYAVCSILSYSCILNHISIGCCGLTSELGRASYPSSEVSFKLASTSISAASVPLLIDRLASMDWLDCESEGRICNLLFVHEHEAVGKVRSWADYPFLWTICSSVIIKPLFRYNEAVFVLFDTMLRFGADLWTIAELDTPCTPVYSGTSERDERFFRLYCADVRRTTLIDAHE